MKIEGVLPALITPFTPERKIDETGFREIIEYVVEQGVSGIVPCGTTGESATLTPKEHEQLINIAIDASNVPVIAGTGSNNTEEAIRFTIHAADAGTGINLEPDLIAELAEIPSVVGVKEASGDLEQVSRIIELTRDMGFMVISGDDALTLPIMSLGGVGVISVAANIAPAETAAFVNAIQSSDYDEARRHHYRLAPLVRAMFIETNPIPVKTAANMMGLPGGPLRLPLAPMGAENEQKLRDALAAFGLLD
jgi:4-hydroxy-tetrahydrodipicolinate synthase